MSKRVLAGALGSIAILAAILASPSPATASSLTYVDGKEVWVSTLDGKSKHRVSNGEGDWRTVVAADNGKMLGVRLEDNKISQLSKIQLWSKDGKVLSQGPLPYRNGGWSLYASPVGADLNSEGSMLAYGYSGMTGFVPNATFYRGHNVVNSDVKSLMDPIGQEGYEWPTMFGNRVVAASGNIISIQKPGEGPFGRDWNSLVDVSGSGLNLARTDVSANGRMLGIELQAPNEGDDRIALVSTNGMEPPVTLGPVDCFIPTVGDASHVTLSQNGQKVAWKDDQGVKIAGVPTGAADPCVFSSPPITISSTASNPSISGAEYQSSGKPGGGLDLTLPGKLKASSLATPKGIAVTVTAPSKGKVTVTGSVPASKVGLKGNRKVVVIKGSAVAGKAGPLKLKLKLVPKYRKFKGRLKGATVTLKIKQGQKSTTRRVKLK